jgi:hypothetical protein
MKFSTFAFGVGVFALVVSVASCRSTPRAFEDPFSTLSEQAQQLTGQGAVVAVGQGSDLAGRSDIARDKAGIDATARVAAQFETKVQQLTKSFTETLAGSSSLGQETNDAFSKAMETLVKQTLTGVRQYGKIMYIKEGQKITAAIIMGIDPKQVAETVKKQAQNTDPKLYERFLASKAYQELEDQMKAYDSSK